MSQPMPNDAFSEAAAPDNMLTVSGELNLTHAFTELRMPDGQTVRVPTEMLTRSSNSAINSAASRPHLAANPDEVTIPLVEEKLTVGKRIVTTGKVRLQKTVQEYQEALDEPLAVSTFDVERVILNHPIEVAPTVRHEGATTIYPLVEEQLILTKQLILKEEIRVTKRDTERRDTQVVTLRREHLTVERESAEQDS